MSIGYDARGNEITGALLDQIGGGVVTDARVASATLAAANAELIMDLNGQVVAIFDLRAAGSTTATFVFEASIDGTNYVVLPAFVVTQNIAAGTLLAEQFIQTVALTTQTLVGVYAVNVAGFRRVRVRAATLTLGSAVATGRASRAARDYAIPLPSTLHVTVTAAANTAATITLPAVAGLFHYITNIHLTRNSTAVLGGTATLVTTSTNLPGNPAWSVGNAMVAGDSKLDLNYTPTTPLKSLLAGVATTIVMPAPGLAVLNRGNCSYYLGA